MAEPLVLVRNLSKTYRVPERAEGLRAAINGVWRRSYRTITAVRDISFSIEAGEVVGFLGPNGAGKTTTLKILSGLLYPTAGEVSISGFIPWQRRPEYLRHISMMLGNKSQMLWDIPPLDSFRVLGEIYRVPPGEFRRTQDELFDLLDMRPLLAKPVRTLSLGERMKCELVAALLHRPTILFLDEPTLGLDISMQRRLRRFIVEYNRRSGATIILTSHYMADVEALCPRIIMIHHGQLLYDGTLESLANRLTPYKILRVTFDSEHIEPIDAGTLPTGTELISKEAANWTLRVPRGEATKLAAFILNTFAVTDVTIENPTIEEVIDQLYQEGTL